MTQDIDSIHFTQYDVGSIYLRVSTKKQKSNLDQASAIQDYAKKNQILISGVFHEKVSGAKIINQTQFKACIDNLTKNIKHLIVYNVSRLGRSIELHNVIDSLLDRGIIIHSVEEGCFNKDSRAVLHALIDKSIVELYEIKRKVKESFDRAAKSGFFIRGKIPVGFRCHTIGSMDDTKRYLTFDDNYKKIKNILRFKNRTVIKKQLAIHKITPKEFRHFKDNYSRCEILVRKAQKRGYPSDSTINTELGVLSSIFSSLHLN